ncbi:Pentatricopeptide repeat-containing protein At2g31400, partial [Durusdinium trenchii]
MLPDPDLKKRSQEITSHAQRRQWQKALDIFRDVKQGGQADVILYTTALGACGGWRRALKLVMEVQESKALQPNITTFSAALRSCTQAAQWIVAFHLLAVATGGSLTVNDITLGAAIGACGKGFLWQDALELLRLSSRSTLRLNIIGLGGAISAAGRTGAASFAASAWQTAVSLLESCVMQTLRQSTMAVNSLIDADAKTSRWRATLDAVRAVRTTVLDLISCSSALAACGKGLRWEESLSLLRGLAVRQLEANTVAYSSAVCQRSWRMALGLLERAAGTSLEADPVICAATISACERFGQWTQALSMHNKLQEEHLEVDLVTQNAAISACGAWARSLRLLGLTLGLQANAVTYGAAVDRVTSDRWPQAVQLLHVGLFRALQATVVTYTSIMALAILWQQSLQMLHQHVLSSLDLVTCNSALHAFQGASAWLQAIHTLKLMEVRRVRPGGISLSLALTAQKGVMEAVPLVDGLSASSLDALTKKLPCVALYRSGFCQTLSLELYI